MNETEKMAWLNEPESWSKTDRGVTIKSMPETDFWRLTHDGGIRHNGHFYHEVVLGNFSFQSRFQGQYKDQYDQSGLMVRASDSEWIKCGIEYVDGMPQASSVVTMAQSDWAISPVACPPIVTFRIQRTGNLIEISYGESESKCRLIRQVTFQTTGPIQAGIMTASPKGNGFKTEFLEWELKS